MKVCNACKTENADDYIYCINCGNVLGTVKKQETPVAAPAVSLVPVVIMLPSPENPYVNTPQTVYVTPAQKAAIDTVMGGTE